MQYPTNSIWKIYIHDKTDRDFSKQSYKRCYVIRSLEDFWRFFNNITSLCNHQMYFMRSNIPPYYECPENKNGGTLGFVIQREELVKPTTIQVLVRLIGESLLPTSQFSQVTGVYLNPKKNGANLRIWCKDYQWLQNNFHQFKLKDIKALTTQKIAKHKF